MAQANVANTLVVPDQSRVAPYFDDFDENKNFHRILFRPGYAVQARELTQLQTILQNQIERFGRHIFVNGSSVIGGKLDVTDIVTLNVQAEYANSAININDFKDKTIHLASGSNDVLARVIQVSPATDTEPAALHVKYISGSEFGAGAAIKTTSNSASALIATTNPKSLGQLGFLYDSIYFMQGYFVKVPSQSVVLSKYSKTPTVKVGLELVESFITEATDTSLLDPALEASNYQAPGAARYKVELVLATRALDSEDDQKFIQLAKIENGNIKERAKNPIYSEIEEVLARRTYDESGNYIVKPFILRIEPSVIDPANNFTAYMSAGKAYLYGYETEVQSEVAFEIPRARDYDSRSNFDLNVNYGNYVYVRDLQGTFNTRMGVVDMHCVSTNQISTASANAYNSTKIGTVRVKDINFYTGASANTRNREFEFYFTEPKFRTLTGTSGNTVVTQSQIHLGNNATISTTDEAYTNAIIRIVGGASAGDERLITSYNGASRVATVASPFTALTNYTSNWSIGFDITDVDCFVQNTVYTSGSPSSNASAEISVNSKVDNDANGDTFITEPNFNNGLFVYPNKFLRPGTTNQSYIYRRVYNGVQFTAGDSSVITSSTDEEFEGGTSTSNTSSTVMDNWLVIVTDPLLSGRTKGEQVAIKATVQNSTPEQATLSTGNTSESFIATVYAKVNATGSAARPRVKTLVLATTSTFTNAAADATFENASGSTTKVYLNAGQVLIKDPGTQPESLFISDVNAVVKVYMLEGEPTPGQDLSRAIDITNRYFFDNGQQVSHYDHGALVLKPGFAKPQGYILACVRYYKSSNDTGYFSIDSYPFTANTVYEEGKNIGTGYTLIPKMSGIKMSDVIDFRPVRPNASNSDFYAFTSARTPVAMTDFRSDYSFYLERYDDIILTLDDSIQRIQGISSTTPAFPQVPDRSMILHKLRVRPYTETVRDIEITTISHRRYTMKDIENIDRRLKNVEYAVSLNTLEKKADDIVIKDVNGLDRTKYGILAESFKSHLLGDVRSPDYKCAIDLNKKYTTREGLLTPRMEPTEIMLRPYASESSNVVVYKDKTILQFTTAPAISQSVATKTTPVAEYLFADFRGTIICNPEADMWKDTKVLPPTVISHPTPKPGGGKPGGGGNGDGNGSFDPITKVEVERLMVLQEGGAYGGLGQLVWNATTGEYEFKDTGTAVITNGVGQTLGMSADQYYNFLNDAVNGTGRFDSTVTISPAIADAIYSSYLAIVDRPPEGTGATYWAAQAIVNGWTTDEIREAILAGGIASGELVDPNINNEVVYSLQPSKVWTVNDYSYNAVDASGNIVPVVNNSAGGGSYTSADFGGTTRDTTPEDFIRDLYANILDRPPDQAGFDYWLQEFSSSGFTQESAESIRQSFYGSEEYIKNFGS